MRVKPSVAGLVLLVTALIASLHGGVVGITASDAVPTCLAPGTYSASATATAIDVVLGAEVEVLINASVTVKAVEGGYEVLVNATLTPVEGKAVISFTEPLLDVVIKVDGRVVTWSEGKAFIQVVKQESLPTERVLKVFVEGECIEEVAVVARPLKGGNVAVVKGSVPPEVTYVTVRVGSEEVVVPISRLLPVPKDTEKLGVLQEVPEELLEGEGVKVIRAKITCVDESYLLPEGIKLSEIEFVVKVPENRTWDKGDLLKLVSSVAPWCLGTAVITYTGDLILPESALLGRAFGEVNLTSEVSEVIEETPVAGVTWASPTPTPAPAVSEAEEKEALTVTTGTTVTVAIGPTQPQLAEVMGEGTRTATATERAVSLPGVFTVFSIVVAAGVAAVIGAAVYILLRRAI